jgi:hypothetical protein
MQNITKSQLVGVAGVAAAGAVAYHYMPSDRKDHFDECLEAVSDVVLAGPRAVRRGYNWWFNLSTLRRARYAAHQEHKVIRTEQRHASEAGQWEVEDEFSGDSSIREAAIGATAPAPLDLAEEPLLAPLAIMDQVAVVDGPRLILSEKAECASEVSRQPAEITIRDQPVPNEEPERDVPAQKSRPRFLSRGARAVELAHAAELKFGVQDMSGANEETVRRWMSRHELVDNYSVRNSDKAALVRRAITRYFTATESDLRDEFIIHNTLNRKRWWQVGLGGY